MAMFNQLSGLNAINFYSTTIFESVFDSEKGQHIGTALTGLAQIVGVLIAPLLGSKFSLKTILVAGTACCTICMSAVAVFAKLIDKPNVELIFILLFLVCFQASQGSFFFTYVAEIAQDAGVGWANFTLFTFILIFALITQTLIKNLGIGYTYVLFACCNLAATIIMYFMLEDISGLSKEQVKELYTPRNKRIGSNFRESVNPMYKSHKSTVQEG